MSSSYGLKQLQVIKDIGRNKYEIHVGAYGTGKTYSIEVALGLLCMSLYKCGIKGLDIVLLGKTQQTVKKNQCNVLAGCFGDNFKYTSSRTDGKIKDAILFGQYINIVGLNDKSAETKFRGLSNLFCIVHDEAVFCTREQFNAIQSRLRAEYKPEQLEVFKKMGLCAPFYIASTNPDAPTHFIKELIDDGKFNKVVNGLPEDAKWQGSKEYYDNLRSLYKEGTLEYKRYLQCQWVAAEGAIFNYFIANHDKFIINKLDKQVGFAIGGLDFGGNKSGTSFVITGLYRNVQDGIVVLHSEKLLRNKGEIDPEYLYNWLILQINIYKKKYDIPLHSVFCDNAEQYLEAGVRNTIRKQGWNITVGDAKKIAIMDRVKFVQRMMALGCFNIVYDCKTIVNSLDGLVYDEKKLTDTMKDDGSTDNDTWDAFSYSFETQIDRFNYI